MDIFQNDTERQLATQSIKELKAHPGWKWLEKAISADLELLDQQLHGTDFTNLEPQAAVAAITSLQDRMHQLEMFRDLPENLLLEASQTQEIDDSDVYDTEDVSDPQSK